MSTLSGQPRIHSALDVVHRFEASILLNGLVSGTRAHRILLEVVRRITRDRPSDLELAFERLQELQSFLNADSDVLTSLGTTPTHYTEAELSLMFEAAKACITASEPWNGPARFQERTAPPLAIRASAVIHGA